MARKDRYSFAVSWLGAVIVAAFVVAGVVIAVDQRVPLAFWVLGSVLVGVLAGLVAPRRRWRGGDAVGVVTREATRAALERLEHLTGGPASSESLQGAQKEFAELVRLADEIQREATSAKLSRRSRHGGLPIDEAIRRFEAAADPSRELAMAAAKAAREAQTWALRAEASDTTALAPRGWLLVAVGAVLLGALLAASMASLSDRTGFAEGLVVIGAVILGWLLASAGSPPGVGTSPSSGSPSSTPSQPDETREHSSPPVGGSPPKPAPGSSTTQAKGVPVSGVLVKARSYVESRDVPPSFVSPLLVLLAGLGLLAVGAIVIGALELAGTEARGATSVVSVVFLLAPLALLAGALVAPEGKRTPWLLGAVATAFLNPFAATMIGDVNELIHKKLYPECLSAQAQAAQIVSFKEARALLRNDGEAGCAKGLSGLHEKKAQASVLTPVEHSPECVAVLAQLDELADDEPQLARPALARETRVCGLVHGGSAVDNRLLAELARR